jgi:hypothetical protein
MVRKNVGSIWNGIGMKQEYQEFLKFCVSRKKSNTENTAVKVRERLPELTAVYFYNGIKKTF